MFVSFTLVSYILAHTVNAARCAIGTTYRNETGTVARQVVIIDIDSGAYYRYHTVSQKGTMYFASSALDRDSMTFYTMDWIPNSNTTLIKYNVLTNEETIIGNIPRSLNALDYNKYNGLLYGNTQQYSALFYTINPITLEEIYIGNGGFVNSATLKISKDGYYIYYTSNYRNFNEALVRARINNFTNQEVLINRDILQRQGSSVSSMDWLTNDINDNTLVLCYDEWYGTDTKCYTINVDNPNDTLHLLFTTDLNSISGIELLYDEYDTCAVLVKTTLAPTTSPSGNLFDPSATFDGAPVSVNTFMFDPYGRFEVSIEITMEDKENVFGEIVLCKSCFIWQYKEGVNTFVNIDDENDDDISMSIIKINNYHGHGNKYLIKLTIQSIRRLSAGNCVDYNDYIYNNRILKPGNTYEIRLKFIAINNEYNYTLTLLSDSLSVITNTLPTSNGTNCIIQNIYNLFPLEDYNLFCTNWENQQDLEFNALIDNVIINKDGFVDDVSEIIGKAPVGNVSITVLVKQKLYPKCIECITINAGFKTISQIINMNGTTIINGILTNVENIISTTSLSENLDVAVSIIIVIEDIYSNNLITQNLAQQIVDDVVTNIIDGSVINTNNISLVVLDDIITELATISSITSNQEIIDSKTTMTMLVHTYLPEIFELIDIFIHYIYNVSTLNDDEEQEMIQDELYIIAQESQQLIVNLESIMGSYIDINDTNESVIASLYINDVTESLIDYATLAAYNALKKSDVGETFNYEITQYDENENIKNRKVIISRKFQSNIDFLHEYDDENDIELPQIGVNNENIILPLTFIKKE
eukprot:1248_1